MVYVKMVNIVTLMGSLGVIKKRSVYAIRKLIVEKVGPIRFHVCWSYINWKIFSKPSKSIVIIIVHSLFSERFDVLFVIQMSFCATLGSEWAL